MTLLESKITQDDIDSWGQKEFKSVIDLFKKFDIKRYDDIFKGKKRIYFEYNPDGKGRIEKQVEKVLNAKGYQIIDYVNGVAKKGNQKIKIGKVLNKIGKSDLVDDFNGDKDRTSKTDEQLLVVVSRHPVDIATMSTSRDWDSCMNLAYGPQKKYVRYDIENGSIIAYLIKKDDPNINRPLGRILIKPYVSILDDSDFIMLPDKIYGNAPPKFRENVRKWVEKTFNGGKTGIYQRDECFYSDEMRDTITRPEITSFDEDKFLNDEEYRNNILEKADLETNGRKVQIYSIPDIVIIQNKADGSFKFLEGDLKYDISYFSGEFSIFENLDTNRYELYDSDFEKNYLENVASRLKDAYLKKDDFIIFRGGVFFFKEKVVVRYKPDDEIQSGLIDFLKSDGDGGYMIQYNDEKYVRYKNGKVAKIEFNDTTVHFGDRYFGDFEVFMELNKPKFKTNFFYETVADKYYFDHAVLFKIRYGSGVGIYSYKLNKSYLFKSVFIASFRQKNKLSKYNLYEIQFGDGDLTALFDAESGEFLFDSRGYDLDKVEINGYLYCIKLGDVDIELDMREKKIVSGDEKTDSLNSLRFYTDKIEELENKL